MTARRALGKFNGISLALAAALGARQLSVRRPLRVGLFSTGNARVWRASVRRANP